jgi:acetyl esterase/lipase
MSHILHPSPDIDPLHLSSPLAGFLCISPCLAFNFRELSYDENAKNDFLSVKQIKRFLDAYLPRTYQREFYSEPLEAPMSWWKGFPAKSTLLLTGDLEIMRDDTVKFAKKFSRQIPGFEFLVCKNEVHVGCAVDFARGAEPLTMTQASWSWFQKTFHSI